MNHAPLHYYRGRVALYAILQGLGVHEGDDVLVQAYTCLAVIEPLRRIGARPIFVDIDRRTLSMDPAAVAAAMTPRTKAVIVQHTFGTPAFLKGIQEITEAAGVPVVEDCAHVTSGAARSSLGSSGAAAFFSYEWGKPVVAGVGGSALINDHGLALNMQGRYDEYVLPPVHRDAIMTAQYFAHRAVARTGVLPHLRGLYRKLAARGVIVGSYAEDPATSPEYGWRISRTVNRRLPARISQAQAVVARRRRLAAYYREQLADLLTGIPEEGPAPSRVALAVADKPRVLQAARVARVELGDWYTTPVHPLTGDDLTAVGYRSGSCPNAEWAAENVVTLPVRADITGGAARRSVALMNRLRARGHA